MITHETFTDIIQRVLAGESAIVIVTNERQIVIHNTTIERWKKIGRELLRPDHKDYGFRLASGRKNKTLYILPSQLYELKS